MPSKVKTFLSFTYDFGMKINLRDFGASVLATGDQMKTGSGFLNMSNQYRTLTQSIGRESGC
jgi:hypothetical protein